jgi:hypothetical protein
LARALDRHDLLSEASPVVTSMPHTGYCMIEAEAIRHVREHFESLFPKTCQSCGRSFATLRDYIVNTERAGAALSYDAEDDDWATREPLGSHALANCSCGSTMALTTDGMSLPLRLALLEWLKGETLKRGVNASAVLEAMRDVIRRQVLDAPGA